ncbi:uncharacterized protein JCM6883_000423 [Sporobolomyces salmoneus]|uniref:uncharacterized protein n=1 Tax=Sporobolomyces salmoneus TaxID=183962 RepID=UPI00316F2149
MFHKKKPPAPLRPIKREPSNSSSSSALPRQALPSPSGPPFASTSTSSTAAPSPLPTTSNYTDFILRSSSSLAPSLNPTGSAAGGEWKHNVMKFSALGERVIDPGDESNFVRPVRLNRKDPRTVRRLTDQDRERFNQRAKERAAKAAGVDVMQVDGAQGGGEGQDNKDGIKEEGDQAAEGTEGEDKKPKEQLDPSLIGKGTSGLTTGGRQRGPGGMFKKKTKRVFVASEESRRLKREEWQPWVLEDDEGQERWVGRLEGGAGEVDVNGNSKGGEGSSQQGQQNRNGASLKGWRPAANASEAGGGGSSYVAFVFGENGDEFQVVPINRWYKFSQGPKYLTLAEEEAEEEWNRQQKSKETERWVMHKRVAPPPSAIASTSTSGDSTPQASTSAAPARKNAKLSANRGGGGANGGNLRDRMMARSAAGIKIDEDEDVRGKAKMKTVISTNDGTGTRSGGRPKGRGGGDQDDDEFDYEEDFQDDEEGIAKIDDLADEEETKELEERIRKEMRAAERPDEIPDDVDEDEHEDLTGTGREIKKLVKKTDKSGAYESDDEENPYASSDEEDDNASVTSAGRGGTSSRQTSPQPSGRAQSPSSQSRQHSPSRAGTPISGSGSGSAYIAKRATSPSGRSSASRNSSPGPSSLSSSSKRKRADGTSGVDSDGDGSKRRKNGKAKSPSPGGSEQIGLLTKEDLVAFFKTRPNQTGTTKDILVHFKKALKHEPKNKAALSGLIRAVADLVNGNLVLKAGL